MTDQDLAGKIAAGVLIAIAVFVVAFLISVLFAFPVKWLWNWLMPEIFGLSTISVWQAWGLNFLSTFFFKSTQTKLQKSK